MNLISQFRYSVNEITCVSKLGDNLRKFRQAQKLTQKQLAQKAGIPQSIISQLETGSAQSTGSIVELAKALKITAEELKGNLNTTNLREIESQIHFPQFDEMLVRMNILKTEGKLTDEQLRSIENIINSMTKSIHVLMDNFMLLHEKKK